MRALIVKNCTKADFCKYTAECNGEKKEASLNQASPFVSKIADVEGYKGDIAVFECRVKPGSYVSWFQNGKKINKTDFRYSIILTDEKLPEVHRKPASLSDLRLRLIKILVTDTISDH